MGQGLIPRAVIKDSVEQLLTVYQESISAIKAEQLPDPTRHLMTLFANPNVQVINNLNQARPLVSIQEYCNSIKQDYNEGITLTVPLNTIRIGNIEHDLGNRYVVSVKVQVGVKAFYSAEVIDIKQNELFKIAFDWDGNLANRFVITGIEEVEKKLVEVQFNAGLGSGQISAPWVRDDQRFTNAWRSNYVGEFKGKYWLNQQIAISAGLSISTLSSRLELDQVNALQGKDPNLIDLVFQTDLLRLHTPIMITYRIRPESNLKMQVSAGLYYSHNLWIETSSYATNRHYGTIFNNVYSDAKEQDRFRAHGAGMIIEMGLQIPVTNRLGVQGLFGASRDLLPLDLTEDPQFVLMRYGGQYNPIWMDPDTRNYEQHFFVKLGLCWLLNPE